MKLHPQVNVRKKQQTGHDFQFQMLRRLGWLEDHKKKVSHSALVNWMVVRNITRFRGEDPIKNEVEMELNTLYEEGYVVCTEGFLKLRVYKSPLKYPLHKYSVPDAIKLTIVDYFKRKNKEIRKALDYYIDNCLEKPGLEKPDIFRRDCFITRKRALIKYISKQRRGFQVDIVEETIDKMIAQEILITTRPGVKLWGKISDDELDKVIDNEERGPYYGIDGKLGLNRLI